MINPTVTPISRRIYQGVSANSCTDDDYTPPNGSTLVIERMGGDSALDSEVKVGILFDTTVLFATHTTGSQSVALQFTGDGTKKLTIKLCNDSEVDETIGGWWEGYILE